MESGMESRRAWGRRTEHTVSDEEIIASYNRTHSGNATAKELGINWKTVYAVLERAGIQRDGLNIYRQNAAFFDNEKAAQLRAEYESGVHIAELSRRYNVKPLAIRSAIKRAGGKVEKVLPLATAEQEQEIVTMFKRGMSRFQISNRLGRSYPFIGRILKRHGLTALGKVREAHHNWKGGVLITEDGYRRVLVLPEDVPLSDRQYALEHRLVMARHLGRPLKRYETVHHINGDRLDNRIENLQLLHGKHGKGQALICNHCGSNDIAESELGHES